jgi:hypothetical protein
MVVTSFAEDYTMTVKNAVGRTETASLQVAEVRQARHADASQLGNVIGLQQYPDRRNRPHIDALQLVDEHLPGQPQIAVGHHLPLFASPIPPARHRPEWHSRRG